jgi:prepilin signal peptidase PulO-like enzyme (type II secretory pathway)
MTPNQAFDILNLIALVAWVLLVLSPRLPGWTSTVTGTVVPALLAAAYVAIVVTNWAGSEGGFSSLSGVAALFSNPWILLAGWTHYLAFDLLVGNWEVHDARTRGIPNVLVLPCLVLTFLFGPAGWLLYVTARSVRLARRFDTA